MAVRETVRHRAEDKVLLRCKRKFNGGCGRPLRKAGRRCDDDRERTIIDAMSSVYRSHFTDC